MSLPSSHKKRFTTVDDIQIYYEVHPPRKSDKKSKNVILIHGMGGCLTSWNSEVKLLVKNGMTVYLMDLRGHGLSDRPKSMADYEVGKQVQDVRQLIDIEKISNPVVIGHCLGGMVAMRLAVDFPNLVQKLVLINTSYNPIEKLKNRPVLKKFLIGLVIMTAKYSSNKHKKNHMNYDLYIGSSNFNIRRMLNDVIHTSPMSYFNSLSTALNFDIDDNLKDIKCETLVIGGENDFIFSPFVAKYLGERIAKSKVVILPRANHISVINNSKEVAAEITTFLRD